jgi:hypothetical protein
MIVTRITKAEAMRIAGVKDYRTFEKYAKLWSLSVYPGTRGDMFSRDEVIKKNNQTKREVISE